MRGWSCPDWPGCYGRLGVPGPDDAASAQAAFPERPLDRARAWKEMAHRYAAGLLGLAVVLIGVLAWRRSPPGRIPALPCFLVVLVAFQALLGMWTVTLGLAPLVVTAHLLAGLATVALLWWLRLGLVRRAGVSGPVSSRWQNTRHTDLGAGRRADNRVADCARWLDQRQLRGARLPRLSLVPGPAPAPARPSGRICPVARRRWRRFRRWRARQRCPG